MTNELEVVLLILLLVGSGAGAAWYAASMQANASRRQARVPVKSARRR